MGADGRKSGSHDLIFLNLRAPCPAFNLGEFRTLEVPIQGSPANAATPYFGINTIEALNKFLFRIDFPGDWIKVFKSKER